jgi:hypothetical protein
MMLIVAMSTLALPALAEEFSLKRPLISTSSVLVPFSARESFGQPVSPTLEPFPGESPQNVEFEIRGGANASGPITGVSVSATRSAYPSPSPLFPR